MEKEDFTKKVHDLVLKLQNTCTLLKVKENITFLNEEFSTIINVVFFYTGFPDIKEKDDLCELYYFQMDIAIQVVKDFYKDLVKEYFDIKEDDDIFFFRYSDLNHNTAIFVSGDNFDGFNITLTDE